MLYSSSFSSAEQAVIIPRPLFPGFRHRSTARALQSGSSCGRRMLQAADRRVSFHEAGEQVVLLTCKGERSPVSEGAPGSGLIHCSCWVKPARFLLLNTKKNAFKNLRVAGKFPVCNPQNPQLLTCLKSCTRFGPFLLVRFCSLSERTPEILEQ